MQATEDTEFTEITMKLALLPLQGGGWEGVGRRREKSPSPSGRGVGVRERGLNIRIALNLGTSTEFFRFSAFCPIPTLTLHLKWRGFCINFLDFLCALCELCGQVLSGSD
jgi:hypothetical protein